MLKKVKCDCGHVNPVGTELCESCGKPSGEESTALLNMRYEGVARRSQVYNKTIVDQIWNFFASVKMAVWMIVITLTASMLGTIFPQQLFIPSNADPFQFYPDQYGFLGYLYVGFGLHNMYSSWWFVSLLVMIGISLVVCSIDRFVPLYRALKTQKVTRHQRFLSRQRIFGKTEHDSPDEILKQVKEILKKKRYNVREEELAVMGEKGRFSRWGPYVNHVGLIIFLIGTLIRILPGFEFEGYVWVRDGETVPVPYTENQYYIKSEGFFLETYKEGEFPIVDEKADIGETVREFRTEAVLFEKVGVKENGELDLVEVKRHSIIVNEPLEYKGIGIYQSDYKPNEFSQFVFMVGNKQTGEIIGEIPINLNHPERLYKLKPGFEVELLEYYPDFELDQNQKPKTKSNVPNNPAFIFKVTTPTNTEGEKSWIFLGKTIEMPGVENEYAIKLKDVKMNNVSGLMVRKDSTLPILLFGGIISMIGLSMGFYWQHRRIWVQRVGREIWLAGHTNKNWFGLQKEVEDVIRITKLGIDNESLDQEGKA
jgi:cytochrome c biogenesis protein